MKSAIFALALVFANFASAKNLEIDKRDQTFQIVKISATQVKGINIRLATEIERWDCNERSLEFALSYVSGNQDFGWFQTQFADAGISMTEIGCPLKTAIKETITSQPIFVKSLINEYADGEISLTLIVPKGFEVLVEEVAK